jgi:hypothetical protein
MSSTDLQLMSAKTKSEAIQFEGFGADDEFIQMEARSPEESASESSFYTKSGFGITLFPGSLEQFCYS